MARCSDEAWATTVGLVALVMAGSIMVMQQGALQAEDGAQGS